MSEQAQFPVNSFREAAPHLRRPFTPAAVKFKVQAAWPKDKPTGGLIVAYIDARLAVERLNLIVPHLWHDEYEPLGTKHLICRLTVDGITRQDIGQGEGKGLYSDALKRAAVKFGVGVSLYAIPKMIVNVSAGHAKEKRARDGLTLEMTPEGESMVRNVYSMWLRDHGVKAFGEALDHGDVLDAAGDTEVEAPATETPASAPSASEPVAGPRQRKRIKDAGKEAALPPIDFANAFMLAAGREPREFDSQDHAEEWANRQLERLPARMVDLVVKEIEQMAAGVIG